MWKVQFTLLLLLCPLAALADDLPPVPPPAGDVSTIAASKGVVGTGKRDAPFIFDTTTVCTLTLTTKSTAFVFDVEDAPTNIVQIDRTLVFSLAEPGLYQVVAHGEGCYARCWFQIKSGTDPPPVVDTVTRRVRAAMAGNPEDAKKFAAVCDEMARALDAGQIETTKAMQDKMQAGLVAVGWVQGKYADMSVLAGELFGKNVPSEPITVDGRAIFAKSFRSLSAACGGVK